VEQLKWKPQSRFPLFFNSDKIKSSKQTLTMNIHDFRRIALSLQGAEESCHMGSPDFRVGNRIFATLAAAKQGHGNIMITPEQQAAFVEELPEVFIPVKGGWGRNGATHVRLDLANEDLLTAALKTAWKLRLEKNAKADKKGPPRSKTQPAKSPAPKKR
jgi:YjbR